MCINLKQSYTPLNIINFENNKPRKLFTNYKYISRNNNIRNFNTTLNSQNQSLFDQYNKNIKIDNNNPDNYNNYNNFGFKLNKIQRNKIARTPILIRRNKTLNNLDLNGIGVNINNNNNNNTINNNYLENNNNNNKYKIKKITKISKINLDNKFNNNNEASSNSVKYTATSGGSIVSIHNNKIHGLPILQGVCSRCINHELIQLKDINKELDKCSKKKYDNYDLLQIEQQRNQELKNRILLKVNKDKSGLLQGPIYNEKNKLIEKNSSAKCKLFAPQGDPIKDKVLDNFFKKEEYLRNKKLIPYNINLDVDKYLKINKNIITKFSVPSIGLEQYQNKYLPTMEQYRNGLRDQILYKGQKEENEKKREKDEFNNNFRQNMIKANNEFIARNLMEQEKNREFMRENQKLMEMRKKQQLLDKSNDIALERKRLKLIEEQEKNELENRKNKKFRIKKELMEKLDEQVRLKRTKSLDVYKLGDNNISYNNVYSETKSNEQFGRCLKCHKLLRKNQICPKEEYELIKETKMKNEEALNKIV